MTKNPAETWNEIDTRLKELTQLEEDWDSYGGHPTSQCAVEEAKRLLQHIEKEIPTELFDPDLMPIADGGICVDITSDATMLSIIISPSQQYSYLVVEHYKKPQAERVYSENSGVSQAKIMELVQTYFKS